VIYGPVKGDERAWVAAEDFSFQRAGTVLHGHLPSRSQGDSLPFPQHLACA